jgi:hypothetical protein
MGFLGLPLYLVISKVLLVQFVKKCRGKRATAPLVLTLENKWSPDLHTPPWFLPGKNSATHWIWPWVHPWTGLEVLRRWKNNFPCRDSNLPARDLVPIQTRLSLLLWSRSSARLIQIICNITFPYTKTFSLCYMTHAVHITSSYHLNQTTQRTETMQSLTVQRNINRTCASVTKIAHIGQKWYN